MTVTIKRSGTRMVWQPPAPIRAMRAWGDGEIIIATDDGLYVLDCKDDKITPLAFDEGVPLTERGQ